MENPKGLRRSARIPEDDKDELKKKELPTVTVTRERLDATVETWVPEKNRKNADICIVESPPNMLNWKKYWAERPKENCKMCDTKINIMTENYMWCDSCKAREGMVNFFCKVCSGGIQTVSVKKMNALGVYFDCDEYWCSNCRSAKYRG